MNLKDYIELNGEREIIDIEALEKGLAKPNPKTIYDIKDGEPYYILFSDGVIKKFIWYCDALGNAFRSLGFAFLTEKEAEARKKTLLIEQQLIRLGGRREFKPGRQNWIIEPTDRGLIVRKSHYPYSPMFFNTKEIAQRVIGILGERYLFDEYFNRGSDDDEKRKDERK